MCEETQVVLLMDGEASTVLQALLQTTKEDKHTVALKIENDTQLERPACLREERKNGNS